MMTTLAGLGVMAECHHGSALLVTVWESSYRTPPPKLDGFDIRHLAGW